MPSSALREHEDTAQEPESPQRQPLLSQPSRLNTAVGHPIVDSVPPKFIHHALSEKGSKSTEIDPRQLLAPVVKTLFKHQKHMTDPHDPVRSSPRGRRSTKSDTRWTTPGSSRKNRTIFTDEQHYALVAAYEADKYPTTIQKELLARQLGLAPIVVINWFQHRRQREPVKEKGGFVRNSPNNSRQGTPTCTPASNMEVDRAESSSVPSINEYFASGNKPSSLDIAIAESKKTTSAPVRASSASIPEPPSVSSPNNDSSSQSGTAPVTPTSSNEQKSAPYYGRMQTVRAPLPGETRAVSNGGPYPKSVNSHVGTIRWELDPLYIAPYIDHGFKDAMIPKDPNAFALRPSPAPVVTSASLRQPGAVP